MGDNQKIYPVVVVDVEARPTLPLVPHGSSSSSEKGILSQHRPPPLIHTIPVIKSSNHPPKKRISCCKCICYSITLLFLLLFTLVITGVILFLIFQPKLPKYSVDRLKISDLRLNFDMSLYAKFNVKITATNRNEKIGIYYKKGSRLSVWYSNTRLCQGTLPKFYQGHRNTTVLNVALTGQNQYGNTLMRALQEQEQTGRIPLDLKVDVPVSIKLGRLKLRKVRILGTCLLIVDSLSANNLISIKAGTCKFRLKL